ncbi:glycerophosphoryl diester phosphodiesterase membrane domain-containing protein [Nocardiopsis alba]|uniref:glycerophosphoryl diester phosphodiesterase membrane domain-containing protein n=1 Tax=Nocardiopsis alba TaxID=53437 RepID=UPI0033B0914F
MTQEDDHRDTSGRTPDGTERQGSPESGESGAASEGWAAPGGSTPSQDAPRPPATPDPTPPPGQSHHPEAAGYGPPPGQAPYDPHLEQHQAPGYGYPPPGEGAYGHAPGGHVPPGHAPPGGQGHPPYHAGPYGPHPGQGRPMAPKPGVVALRPMSLGDVFNGAFGYIRNNPKTTMGLAIIVMGLASILSTIGSTLFLDDYTAFLDDFAADPYAVSPDDPIFPFSPLSTALVYLGSLVTYLGGAVLLGLLAAVIGMSVLGHRLTPKQAWRAARGRIGAVLGLSLIKLVMQLVLGVVFFLGMILALFVGIMAGMAAGGDEGVLIGIVVTLAVALLTLAVVVAPALWIWVRLYYAMPVVVLERIGPFKAMARSWRLSRGSWWRTLGYWLLAMLIVMVVQMVLNTPAAIVSGGIAFFAPEAAWGVIVSAAVTYVATVLLYAITQPFVAGVNTLLYIDLRMRREGLDLRLHQAAQRGEGVGPEIYLPERSA